MSLNLYEKTFTCSECNEEFHLDEMREILARWAKVVA
jgi:transcription initiation factor IIE alpha subunit